MTSTHSREGIASAVFTTILGLCSAGTLGLVGYVVQNEHWKGRAMTQLEGTERLHRDVSTSLAVLGDHGAELQLLRTQIEGVRGQLTATRLELLEAIKDYSDDRFRRSDWEREKQILEYRLSSVQATLKGVQDTLKELEAKITAKRNGNGK